ncbi:hypothetical protein NKI04_26470 [Mesorhizobium sp. M0814]|uniref:hypothetical protein n=1 Tax=Mesorhizobium sp. M0814 TaxID=2957004 RepID=UPI0033392BA5
MTISISKPFEQSCPACGGRVYGSVWFIIARHEQPLAWAQCLKDELNQLSCSHGHVQRIVVPTLLYDRDTGKIIVVTTAFEAANREMGGLMPAFRESSGLLGDEVHCIERHEVRSALQKLEVARAIGRPEFAKLGGRVFVTRPAPSYYFDVFEHPTPYTARQIAERCAVVLGERSLPAERLRDVKAQRALCLSLAPDARPGEIDEAISLFSEVIGLFKVAGQTFDWAATCRNMGTALLRRSNSASRTADAAAAIKLFSEAAPYLTKAYSLGDWSRLEVSWAEALIRVGSQPAAEEKLREVASLRDFPDAFDSISRAKKLLANQR